VQDPKVAASNFDWIAAPKHDGLIGRNVTATLGAVHGITPERLAQAKERFATAISRLPHPRVAVVLGGNSRAFRFAAADAAKFGLSLATMAVENKGSLLVTPSPRTPREAIDALQRAILRVPHLIWDGTGENPYLAFLGFADAIVVTGDSVNMVTEAAGTGKPVYVESLRGGSRRLARFHALMNEAGATRPFTGHLDEWSYAPVNDTEMVAAVIRHALGIEKSRSEWAFIIASRQTITKTILVKSATVTRAAENLKVDIRQEIIVSLPGTNYIAIFPKPADRCVLANKPFAWEQDTQTPITPAEFLRWAYDIASIKARDLGWTYWCRCALARVDMEFLEINLASLTAFCLLPFAAIAVVQVPGWAEAIDIEPKGGG
jgi:Mitochondrial fission ELM1